jgi:hypothetical protein
LKVTTPCADCTGNDNSLTAELTTHGMGSKQHSRQTRQRAQLWWYGAGKKRKRGGFFFLEIRQPDEFRFVQVLNNFKGLIFPKFNYSIV